VEMRVERPILHLVHAIQIIVSERVAPYKGVLFLNCMYKFSLFVALL
jgi:hypothetical protein